MNDGPDPQPSATQGMISLATIVTFLAAGALISALVVNDGHSVWGNTLRIITVMSLSFIAATIVLGFVGARARRRAGLDHNGDPSYDVPIPGPDDPVFLVEWEHRGDGCTRLDAHDGHPWFWKAVDREGYHGSVWCKGVPPR